MHYTYLPQLLPDEKMRKSPLCLRDTHWKEKASLLVQISHRLNKEQKRDTELSDFTTLQTGCEATVGDQNYFLNISENSARQTFFYSNEVFTSVALLKCIDMNKLYGRIHSSLVYLQFKNRRKWV